MRKLSIFFVENSFDLLFLNDVPRALQVPAPDPTIVKAPAFLIYEFTRQSMLLLGNFLSLSLCIHS